jgi:hypothetical protein
MDTPIVDSCDLYIAATRVTINGTPIHVAGPVATFYSLHDTQAALKGRITRPWVAFLVTFVSSATVR